MTIGLAATPEELRAQFLSLRTAQDIADLLEVELQRLYYHIYIVPKSDLYTEFNIPKRRGGLRKICAPDTALKIIQQKLSQVLLHVYEPKPSVHSFLLERSIVTNARVHQGRRHILNVDLKDFFPSINFGRVRGMFMSTPYKLEPAVATVLAQICSFNNQLPQGAPTSPIVSNMICARLDSQLMRLAKRNRCDYTRYADDLTFSTNLRQFPPALATINESGQIEIGTELVSIIAGNGFQINTDKVTLRQKTRRQEVTGLTINKFPNVRRKYVRNVRAMLHAWEKFGLEAAEKEFRNRLDKKHRSPWKQNPSFKRVVKGKIDFLGMVRGKSDRIYLTLHNQLRNLAPELFKEPEVAPAKGIDTALECWVTTEGKTDCKHLKAAFVRLRETGSYAELHIQFDEYDMERGADALLALCTTLSNVPQTPVRVCIFDRDKTDIVKKVSHEGRAYKDWGNNVFSFPIPVPAHRQENPLISLEFYYKDSEIQQKDNNERRLFLSSEFDDRSGRHKTMDLVLQRAKRIRDSHASIIDCDVFDTHNKNVALSKDDFAGYVLDKKEGFANFDVSEFRKIFDVILMIAKHAE